MQMRGQFLERILWIHVGHQAARNLRGGLACNHGLRALALIATLDAVAITRGSTPCSLHRIEAWLAKTFADASLA